MRLLESWLVFAMLYRINERDLIIRNRKKQKKPYKQNDSFRKLYKSIVRKVMLPKKAHIVRIRIRITPSSFVAV